MIIKELILNDEEEMAGVQAVSLVINPALQSNFVYFNEHIKMGRRKEKAEKVDVDLNDWYRYYAEPLLIDTSHQFCKGKAGRIFNIKEINKWNRTDEWIPDSSYFANFNSNVSNFSCDQQVWGCRHFFKKIKPSEISEIPEYKIKMFPKKEKLRKEEPVEMMFKISNPEKREIEGVALRSGQFIYRTDVDGAGEGYVYFSRKTVKQIKEKYGFNRTITIEHAADITGTAILMDSWLEEYHDPDFNEWKLRYKIVDDALWEVIKHQLVVGFSIEGLFDFRK